MKTFMFATLLLASVVSADTTATVYGADGNTSTVAEIVDGSGNVLISGTTSVGISLDVTISSGNASGRVQYWANGAGFGLFTSGGNPPPVINPPAAINTIEAHSVQNPLADGQASFDGYNFSFNGAGFVEGPCPGCGPNGASINLSFPTHDHIEGNLSGFVHLTRTYDGDTSGLTVQHFIQMNKPLRAR